MKKDTGIVSQVLDKLQLPDLLEGLAGLSASDLNSLLLAVLAEHAQQRNLRDIRTAAERTELFGPSSFDQRSLHTFDGFFFRALPNEFDAIELSPVTPLGLNSSLTAVSQNNLLSALRGMEVVANPSTAMALEAARRRRELLAENPRDPSTVDLATCQRILRLQPFDKSLGYMQHFDVFALCTAGRVLSGVETFTITNALRHLRIHLDLVRILIEEGFTCRDVSVYISDIRLTEALVARAGVDRAEIMRHVLDPEFDTFEHLEVQLPSRVDSVQPWADALEALGCRTQSAFLTLVEQEVLRPLQLEYPEIRVGIDLARLAGMGCYQDFCFHVYAANTDGREVQLSDGGTSDWTKRLLSNRKERLITSGFGAELVHRLFRG